MAFRNAALFSSCYVWPFLSSQYRNITNNWLESQTKQTNKCKNKNSKMKTPLITWISHSYLLCFLYLNDMIILPKYNSPNSDVVSSNAPPPMSAEVVLLGDFC